MNYELKNKKLTESQEVTSQSLEKMLRDTNARYRTFLFVGEVGNGKSFLARKLSESKKYDYINIVDQLDKICDEQNLEKLQPEWLIRYLENMASRSDAPVIIFDELESVILANKNSLLFTKILLRIMDKKDFGRAAVLILSISNVCSLLPSFDLIKENWSSGKLITLSLQDEDIHEIATHYNIMWDKGIKSFDIVKARLWRDLSE